jgi:hypothetical protein
MANLIMTLKLIPSSGSGKSNLNGKSGGHQWVVPGEIFKPVAARQF